MHQRVEGLWPRSAGNGWIELGVALAQLMLVFGLMGVFAAVVILFA